MRTYPDLYRIRYDSIAVSHGKRYFDQFETERKLFKQEVVVTEKIDGSQLAVGWKSDRPYLQGKNSHITEFDKRQAYAGAWDWAWTNLDKIEKLKGYLVFGEWAKVQHNLPYDSLPDWFVAFDVWDAKNKRFMDYDAMTKFVKDVGFAITPLLYRGRIKKDALLDIVRFQKSNYLSTEVLENTKFSLEEKHECKFIHHKGQTLERFLDGKVYMEGCVLKPIRGPKFTTVKKTTYWTNSAKLVVQEFLDEFLPDVHWTSSRKRLNKKSE